MLMSDNPIQSSDDDVLDRTTSAEKFVQQVLALDASEGIVVGVFGPWGAGKTSFINLAREEFRTERITILDFNPWMFSGAEQLVKLFFGALVAQLRGDSNLAKISKYLEKYGKIFSELLFTTTGNIAISGIIKNLSEIRSHDTSEQKSELEKALDDLDNPIVVVLDDIDRLTPSEIRDVFKLVRLTANFPNIIYIVVCDRDRVEDALTEQGIRGRDYLEKILQVAFDLPIAPSYVLNNQINSHVDRALDGIENLFPRDDQVWSNVLIEIIRPLIRNMRDVRRYAATIHGSVRSLNGQIALADLLALEAIRIFLPDVFKLLHGAIEGLTTDSDATSEGHSNPLLKAQVDGLIEAAGDHRRVVKSMIEQLFPKGASDISRGDLA